MTPLVLVHGGGFDGRCWDLVLPRLAAPAVAVDLPGRGRRPADLGTVTFADCAAAIAEDADRAGFDEVVLVGHSLAGCSLPAAVGRLGERVRHAVFVACTVPEDGTSALDTLEPEIQALARGALESGHTGVLDPAVARVAFGNDLDDERFAWCAGRMVGEAPRLTLDPVDLAPLRAAAKRGMGRTWVRTLRDAIVAPGKQLRFATNVGDCEIVDVDAGHMCMVGRPELTAAVLDRVSAS